MPKVRRRKSTNVYAGRDDDFAALKSSTIDVERSFKVTVSAPTPKNDFEIVYKRGAFAANSNPISDVANRDELKTAITSGATGAYVTNVEDSGTDSGPLQTSSIEFKATLNRLAKLSAKGKNANIEDLSHGDIKKYATWNWSCNDVWRDIGTSRGLMLVKKMEIKARRSGKWELTYAVEGYARRHQWVYKLDALDGDGQVLFTLVTPSTLCKPNERVHRVSSVGRSQQIRTYYDEIDRFVRRGAGEYRV
jgi:hypothetical protein